MVCIDIMVALNTFSLLVLFFIIYAASNTVKQNKINQKRIIKTLAVLVLSFNIYHIIDSPTSIPVEFSTVTYFVAPIIILLNIKRLEVWAIYSSIMAGFFYYLTMISVGGNVYELYSPINVYTSLFCHGSVFFIAIVKLKTNTYNSKDYLMLLIGNAIIVIWALYIRSEFPITGRLFIYELTDAVHIKNATDTYLWIFLPLYYVTLGYLVYWSSKYIFKLNKRFHNKWLINQNRSQI